MEERKRRHFWVDAPFQLQIMGTVLVLVAASVLIVSFSILKGLEVASESSRQLFFSLDWARQSVRGPLLLAGAIAMLASGLVALIWSHRLAAPLRVLAAGIARLRHGDFSIPLRVRENDAHHQLIRDFAHMQEHLRRALETDRRHVESALRKLEEAAESLPADHPAKKELAAAAHRLKSVGTEYRL